MAKPKSKTEKKIDNNVRLALTAACDQFLEDVPGFQWLTHQANYTNFPASLLVTCVFDTPEQQQQAERNEHATQMRKLIQAKLLKVGVKFKALNQQILFDSEAACTEENDGNWASRLEGRAQRTVAKNRPH